MSGKMEYIVHSLRRTIEYDGKFFKSRGHATLFNYALDHIYIPPKQSNSFVSYSDLSPSLFSSEIPSPPLLSEPFYTSSPNDPLKDEPIQTRWVKFEGKTRRET